MSGPLLTKVVAIVAIVAGLAVLAIEVTRFRSGESVEIWLWGSVAAVAVVLGVWELAAGINKSGGAGPTSGGGTG